jgi:hypothetical protein
MDRLIAAFEALVRFVVADLFYCRVSIYSVVTCNAQTQTVALRSLDSNVPDLTNVPFSSPGLILNPLPGTLVKVGYAGTQPYVAGLANGALRPLVPGSGSGVQNEIDAGYVLIIQTPILAIAAQYFPAGVAGGLAAESARAAAVVAGNTAFLLHMGAGRILPTAWTVP